MCKKCAKTIIKRIIIISKMAFPGFNVSVFDVSAKSHTLNLIPRLTFDSVGT